jgi:hypothetical protein
VEKADRDLERGLLKNKNQYDEMITKFTHASGDREMIKHDLERTKLLISSTATD